MAEKLKVCPFCGILAAATAADKYELESAILDDIARKLAKAIMPALGIKLPEEGR